MTTNRPSAAGVFVVRDPEVCDAVAALLTPHYTGPAPASEGPTAADLLAEGIEHLDSLTGRPADSWEPDDTTIVFLLDHAYTAGNVAGLQEADTENRNRREELAAALQRAETDLARAEKNIGETNDQLRAALAKIARLEKAAAESEPAIQPQSDRSKDRQSFESLAQRMESQALAQPREIADVLRLSARAVRDEIAVVYASTAKKTV